MSRAQTKKQQPDLSKPIIKVESAEEFFKKENDDGTDLINHDKSAALNTNGKTKKEAVEKEATNDIPVPAPKKNEIIIPVIKQTEDPLKNVPELHDVLYKKRKFQSHYIRIDYCNPKPTPEVYEPTDKDFQFIKEINEKLPKAPRGSTPQELTLQNFVSTIETWENSTEKNDTISLFKAIPLVETQYTGVLKDAPNKIYDYWKNLREIYQRPLLRKYLSAVNENDNNPNAAFRSRKVRESRTINTRRPKKVNDAENLEKMKVLKQDFEMAIALLGNIRYREMVKLEVMEIEQIDFEASLKEKGDSSQAKLVERFKQNYENEAYLKLRKRMQDFNTNAVNIINKPEQPEPIPVVKTVPPKDEELNFDLGSFIASIMEESFNKDISLQKVQMLDLPSVSEELKPPLLEPQRSTMEEEKVAVPSPFQRNDRKNSYNLSHPFPPDVSSQRSERNRNTQPILQKPKPQPIVEEKLIEKFRLQRRMGRQRRILLDRVFEDEENLLQSHPRDFYHMELSQNETLFPPEVYQKLPNNNMRDLYLARFGKFRDMWPYNDSDEENEAAESAKIKSLANNFKAFIKQQRPVTQVI